MKKVATSTEMQGPIDWLMVYVPWQQLTVELLH